MSALREAAAALLDDAPECSSGHCHYCARWTDKGMEEHRSDCPERALRAALAAEEGRERVNLTGTDVVAQPWQRIGPGLVSLPTPQERIDALAAEVAALRAESDALKAADEAYGSDLEGERDRLRADNDTLRAERDAARNCLRATEAAWKYDMEAMAKAGAADTAELNLRRSERDAARAEVERLREGLREILRQATSPRIMYRGQGREDICEVDNAPLVVARALLSGKDAP